MIGVDYVRRMARYNRWQNENLYGAADGLTDEERHRERGAFFGSIHRTMCHLLWADQTWMSRFRDTPLPVPMAELAAQHRDWTSPEEPHGAISMREIVGWADGLAAGLAGWHAHPFLAEPWGARYRSHAGCSCRISSITRLTIAVRFIAC